MQMKENSSKPSAILDRNWVLKRKRGKLSAAIVKPGDREKGYKSLKFPSTTPSKLELKANASLDGCSGKRKVNDGVPKDVDSNGIPDHLGSWKNKKALIELLDQVEDVISVEPNIPKDRETLIGTERFLKADHVVNRLTHDSGGKNCNMGSDVSFLVLEVTERHIPADLLTPQTSFKLRHDLSDLVLQRDCTWRYYQRHWRI